MATIITLGTENFTNVRIDSFAFSHGIGDSLEFGQIVGECINHEIKEKYQLEA